MKGCSRRRSARKKERREKYKWKEVGREEGRMGESQKEECMAGRNERHKEKCEEARKEGSKEEQKASQRCVIKVKWLHYKT